MMKIARENDLVGVCVCEKESQQANEWSKDRLGYRVGPVES